MTIKSSDETGKEFAAFLSEHGIVGPGRETCDRLFDAHTDAVAYEAQKHVLNGLLAHAEKHYNSVNQEVVNEAWAHERNYIQQCLGDLENEYNPVAPAPIQSDDLIETLQQIFGNRARIISTEELMTSPEFASVQNDEKVTEAVEAAYPRINEGIVGRFIPTHRHIKGGYYMKLGDASVEADMTHVVIYANRRGETFTRPVTEFMERFEEIN